MFHAEYRYEVMKLADTKPQIAHSYTPDFILPNGIIVETKVLWDLKDRKKHQLIREQHSGLDIRLVFSCSKSPIRKGSKTSYGDWCSKLGTPFADKVIPQAWIDEPNEASRHIALVSAASTQALKECPVALAAARARWHPKAHELR